MDPVNDLVKTPTAVFGELATRGGASGDVPESRVPRIAWRRRTSRPPGLAPRAAARQTPSGFAAPSPLAVPASLTGGPAPPCRPPGGASSRRTPVRRENKAPTLWYCERKCGSNRGRESLAPLFQKQRHDTGCKTCKGPSGGGTRRSQHTVLLVSSSSPAPRRPTSLPPRSNLRRTGPLVPHERPSLLEQTSSHPSDLLPVAILW